MVAQARVRERLACSNPHSPAAIPVKMQATPRCRRTPHTGRELPVRGDAIRVDRFTHMGGDDPWPPIQRSTPGPPPRARGRWRLFGWEYGRARSTPACAGTIPDWASSTKYLAVHPRVRGDDAVNPVCGVCIYGPPPRARGRYLPGRDHHGHRRSTPACAGTMS